MASHSVPNKSTLNYTSGFYRSQSPGSLASAKKAVPVILDLIHPKSVVDVGCGVGTWLSVFREYGVEDALGIDGGHVKDDMLLIPPSRFLVRDLSAPFHVGRRFDLVLCLEVAEHLPPESAAGFVSCLTQLGPCVVFSAAVPFQGGTNHVNEQWPEYWIQHFRSKGYTVVDALRGVLWDEADVEWWYAQNTFIFVESNALASYPRLKEAFSESHVLPYSVIHPRNYIRTANLESVSPRRLLRALPRSFAFAFERLKQRAFPGTRRVLNRLTPPW
jgi:SAM-dependent methyltransferase